VDKTSKKLEVSKILPISNDPDKDRNLYRPQTQASFRVAGDYIGQIINDNGLSGATAKGAYNGSPIARTGQQDL
jgi:hypothetical protein